MWVRKKSKFTIWNRNPETVRELKVQQLNMTKFKLKQGQISQEKLQQNQNSKAMCTSSHLRTIKQPSTIVKGVELVKENNEQQQQPTTIVNGVELVKENYEQETLCTHIKKIFKIFFF